MPFLAVLYNPDTTSWLRFTNPVEEVEAHDLDAVLPALQHIEQRVEREGLHAAGFVSYEAAPAFDDALQTLPATDFPLLHFGLFNAPEHIYLPAPAERPPELIYSAGISQEAFAEKVDNIRAAIARGETYQVNLTFPLDGKITQEPWQFFLQLVQGQQPISCGFLQNDRWAICSASPELFFSRGGSQLTMRPMKGTAPRGRTYQEDQQRGEALQQSEKNRAENIMILDMVRNDLGRLAPPGEVRTEAICALEKYPTVWQLTSTATATASSNASIADVFQALFPCASITGAPKAKTMEIITKVEDVPRDLYTGTFGWMAPGHRAHFNVAIRTALIDRKKQQMTYGVGAGITWDSNSAEEYSECLDKAAVLLSDSGSFALIETLRWTPAKGYFLLEEHLSRLQSSAEYFDFAYKKQTIVEELRKQAHGFSLLPQRVRLILHRDGRLDITSRRLEETSKEPVRVRLADAPVNREDLFLYHKTTRREIYDLNLAKAEDMDEVVLWNQQEEVTEGCTTTLVVEKDGRLMTPALSCGLLPGTYRDYLLKKGVIDEAVISKEDLRDCTRIYLVNAVRKWRRAILC